MVEPESSKVFQFVNAYPQSKDQRIRTREIIRSHASHVHWQKKRQAQLNRLALTAVAGDDHAGETESESMLLRRPSISRMENDREYADTTATGSKILLPGLGRMGLVDTFDSALPYPTIRTLVKQINHVLLQLLPPEPGQTDSFAVKYWLQSCVSHRGLLHAFLYGQMVLNRANQVQVDKFQRDERELLLCYSEAVREINKRFDNPLTACDDVSILAVLALASTGKILDTTPAKSPSRGPLTAMQVLNVYGGMSKFSSTHVKGLVRMVSVRGGLKTIALPGLAAQICYGDIIAASKKLAKPAFSYTSFTPKIEEHLRAVHRQNHPLNSLGNGFAVLYQLLSPQDAEHLCPVLHAIGAYTIAVHDYVNCTSRAFPLGFLADARNFVQHSLMSLIYDEEQSPLLDLCHLAATIYSLLVVFPLPATTAPMTQLGLRVKEGLSSSSMKLKWNEAIGLMLWITVMGAIASVGAHERSWYISTIDRLRYRLGFTCWLDLKTHLQEFLWFSSTNDVDGVDLWNEIAESSPFTV